MKRKTVKRMYLGILVMLVMVSNKLSAQISGTISDKNSGEPLQGAVIKFSPSSNGQSLTALSGLDGSFAIRSIPNGNYKVSISYVGYLDYETEIEVAPDKTKKLNLEMVRKDMMLEDVVVTGNTNNSDYITSQIERKSENIVSAVSSRAIEISPDLSVANVSQRVPGVTIERGTNGEGQYAIVRGMEKRYNYTLVNGIKIPSPDNKNRYVPLDIFPADLLERLEVTKTLKPDMEGDAIGGVVNMVMKEAPDKFTLNANFALGEAQKFLSGEKFNKFDYSGNSRLSPRVKNGTDYLASMADFNLDPFKHKSVSPPLATSMGLSGGGRLFNNRLGILVAGSYQSNFRNVNSIFFKTETDRVDNSTLFTHFLRRDYSIQQKRGGLHARLDYNFNEKNKLKLYLGKVILDELKFRFQSDTGLVLGRIGPGTGRIDNSRRNSRKLQEIFTSTLQGEHSITNSFSMKWIGVYSKATGYEPDRGNLATSTGVSLDNGKLVQQPEYIDNPKTFMDWSRNSDNDKSGYLNFYYDMRIMDASIKWSLGGMYRDKQRKSDYDKYNLRGTPSPQEYNGDVDNNTFVVFNPQGSSSDALNYKAYEKVGAGYGMVTIKNEWLETVLGVRYEHTDFGWHTSAPLNVEGTIGSSNYYDVLPSANFKFRVNPKQFIRASYYSAISRPGFYEVTPHIYDDGTSDYPEMGNPFLKRTTAENFDLRYEIFPKGLDQILLGIFYKDIHNPIEYAIVEKGANATYYMPDNFGNASNYGFEFDFLRYFHFWGIKMNYTYTKSQITTSKIQRIQEATSGGGTTLTQKTVNQTRPLQGQSQHVGNLSILYKNGKSGIDLQLAAVYTGERINTVSPFLNNDTWQKGFIQLDLSGEIRIVRRLSLYAKVNNVLNTPYKLEIKQKNNAEKAATIPHQKVDKNAFIRRDVFGTNYLIGIKFHI